MTGITDAVAIVTGGALGIGGATARRLAYDGAKVLIVDINEEAADANVRQIKNNGGAAIYMVGDVAVTSIASGVVERAVTEWGRLDILVQNAYGGSYAVDGTALSITEETFDTGLRILTRALFLGAKFAVPAMEDSGPMPSWTQPRWEGAGLRTGTPPRQNVGRIVNMSSVHGILQAPKALVYETGKAAVIGLTRQMAIDFGPLGITVNAIAPGHIVTESGQKTWMQHGNDAGFKLFELQYPVRRTGVPDDIANGVAFLCSPDASFVTGIVLPIDGGLSIQLQENIVMDVKDFIVTNPDLHTYFDLGRGAPRM